MADWPYRAGHGVAAGRAGAAVHGERVELLHAHGRHTIMPTTSRPSLAAFGQTLMPLACAAGRWGWRRSSAAPVRRVSSTWRPTTQVRVGGASCSRPGGAVNTQAGRKGRQAGSATIETVCLTASSRIHETGPLDALASLAGCLLGVQATWTWRTCSSRPGPMTSTPCTSRASR